MKNSKINRYPNKGKKHIVVANTYSYTPNGLNRLLIVGNELLQNGYTQEAKNILTYIVNKD